MLVPSASASLRPEVAQGRPSGQATKYGLDGQGGAYRRMAEPHKVLQPYLSPWPAAAEHSADLISDTPMYYYI